MRDFQPAFHSGCIILRSTDSAPQFPLLHASTALVFGGVLIAVILTVMRWPLNFPGAARPQITPAAQEQRPPAYDTTDTRSAFAQGRRVPAMVLGRCVCRYAAGERLDFVKQDRNSAPTEHSRVWVRGVERRAVCVPDRCCPGPGPKDRHCRRATGLKEEIQAPFLSVCPSVELGCLQLSLCLFIAGGRLVGGWVFLSVSSRPRRNKEHGWDSAKGHAPLAFEREEKPRWRVTAPAPGRWLLSARAITHPVPISSAWQLGRCI